MTPSDLASALSDLSQHRPDNLQAIAEPEAFRQHLEVIRRRMLEVTPQDSDSSASEWFLDNFYLLAEASQQLGDDMPARFYRDLPTVVWEGRSLPRAYVVAQAMLDGLQVPDHTQIECYLSEFQAVTPLRIGELWALPTMMRVVSLQRIVDTFGPAPAPAPVAVDRRSSSRRTELVSTSIRTLIVLKSISWRALFEACSLVHLELCNDPVDVYSHMAFDSCDRYRRAVEAIAARTCVSEVKVARAVVEMARQHLSSTSERQGHVGYYLIDAGRQVFERELGCHPPTAARIGRVVRRFATPTYLLMVAAATVIAMLPLVFLLDLERNSAMLVALAFGLAFVPASSFGIAWVHWILTQAIGPRPLPRLALKHGIPMDCAAAVVIPTLLGDLGEVHQLVKQLEQHYLANPEPALQFALLADYLDADSEETEQDVGLFQRCREGIELLNDRYGNDGRGPFHLLLRKRKWNPREGVWMGWERKRGKLDEFNRLLAGQGDTSFSLRVGHDDALKGIRFVITLDSDTELPRGAACELISILSHPLNRAEFEGDKVIAGYTVLQPRVDINPDASHRSRFTRIFAGDTGLDIYSRAVSDVYQDLFDTGVFVGKGIYDLDAFRRSIEGRVPENAVLSHDLFEGIHGRVGLVTDIVLYEDYPRTYLAFAHRLHRWIRGDWQLLPWLGFRVPTPSGARVRSPLSHIDRWKLLDNLRRSLHPVALCALLLAGWTILPGSPAAWTAFALLLSAAPLLTSVASRLRAQLRQGSRRRLGEFMNDLPNEAMRWMTALVSLPYEATVVIDAIIRTLGRLFLTHRRLLEWTTAAHIGKRLSGPNPRAQMWWAMKPGPILALVVACILALTRPSGLWAALPFLLFWFASPELSLWLAKPSEQRAQALSAEDRQTFRLLARRIWLFFETFVGPADQWLPPDNIQQNPELQIAHRTSPTNIGMYLTSAATAYDLGHLELDELSLRLRNTFRTIATLERHRGQVLNWYDTRTLEPLLPKYVSTVDNGNLAASLIALRQACAEYAAQPVLRRQSWDGLADLAALVSESMQELLPSWTSAERSVFESLMREISEVIAGARTPDLWLPALGQLLRLNEDLLSLVKGQLVDHPVRQSAELGYEVFDWLDRFDRQILNVKSGIETLAGWLFELSEAPSALTANEDVRAHHRALLQTCQSIHLDELAQVPELLSELELTLTDAGVESVACTRWLQSIGRMLAQSIERADQLIHDILDVGSGCERELACLDFAQLYDTERNQFFIGYDVSAAQPDHNHYDLLASEARLASIVAIAFGQVPTKHWFHLRRPTAQVCGHTALLSWSGTMFEYLMPPLFTRSFGKTLLGRTNSLVVERQIEYGRKHKVPWGVSESAFALCDKQGQYQYRAFGVPGVGLKRGLSEDLVIAPYASLLAAATHAKDVASNLKFLQEQGAWHTYGAVEAIDYTPGRRVSKSKGTVVHAYMAHHQGMSLVSLGNILSTGMVVRFHADLRIQTAAHLLQERLPADIGKIELPDDQPQRSAAEDVADWSCWVPQAASPTDPQVHVLSNGRLSVRCDRFARGGLWLKDVELRPWESGQAAGGFCLFLRDDTNNESWALDGVLGRTRATEHSTSYSEHSVETFTRLEGLSIRHEIFIVADDDVEVRRVTVVNEGTSSRSLTLTGYSDVSINRPGDHHRHPTFSQIFLYTSVREEGRILLCRRRPRGPGEAWPVFAQACIGAEMGGLSWDTSRLDVLGRGNELANASVLQHGESLGETQGNVLNPCLTQRVSFQVKPGQRRTIAWLSSVGKDEARVLRALAKYSNLESLDASAQQSEIYTRARLARLGLDGAQVARAQRVLARLQHWHHGTGALDRRRLWGHGVSGDHRLLLFHWRSDGATLLAQLLKMHALWKSQHVAVELVILLHELASYVDDVRQKVLTLAKTLGLVEAHLDMVVVSTAHLAPADVAAFEAAASFVVDEEKGSIEQQLEATQPIPKLLPQYSAARGLDQQVPCEPVARPLALTFDNGLGGFAADGKSYQIYLEPGRETPAPWCNVLANREFGCLVSENGLGSTWAVNASENRLTPWSNDPVSDRPSEVIYIRDEEDGDVWSTTPRPCGADTAYLIEHGLGWTEYRHNSHGLEQCLRVSVSPDQPLKFVELKVRNLLGCSRRLTVSYYLEWLLGTRYSESARFVRQSCDAEAQALFAQNPWLLDGPEQTAFLACSDRIHGFTCDREEFLGLGGLAAPDALKRWGLSNSETPAAESCGVLQAHLDLAAGAETSLHFVLGWGSDMQAARATLAAGLKQGATQRCAEALVERWQDILGVAQVTTPQASMDLMLNTWALYQTVSGRVFARTGFYQSSGAFGFRDQLQDVMALCFGSPALAREQILRAAAHQFEAGDVLHWWHPPVDRGVRTRCSDDMLWLPYVVAYYVRCTGDEEILNQQLPFLEGPELEENEHDRYGAFEVSTASASLREHCHRAIERASRFGQHGLPLMGGGDWNDGMNLVGVKGQGESVWLAWFLYATARSFAGTCERVGEEDDAKRLHLLAERVKEKVENAWDGSWYLRAYYDDGTPLGTHRASEARIDSISQSWAVLSGAAQPERAATAVDSALEELVDRDAGVARLLWPPFDTSAQEPGYIKGYPPGVRENGAQYTHAATWLIWALADLGRGSNAEELFRRLNPIEHGATAEKIQGYRTEPYVLCGDVYSTAPHRGMGGWSWYTGSAAWYWRVGIEALLGVHVDWPYLQLRPRIPSEWPECHLRIRFSVGQFDIWIRNPERDYDEVLEVRLDGELVPDGRIPLHRSKDGNVELLLGRSTTPQASRDESTDRKFVPG